MTTAMREKSKTPIAKALSMLLVLFAIVECCSMMMPAEAHASEMAHLTSGGRINYAGYYTTWFDVDGEVAYCGNPSASTPESGLYEKREISATSGRNQETVADLWFGYGSPGFDKSLWPATWYDGSPMTDERYAALAHILLSDTFSSNGHYALFGTDETFASWCRQNVIGYGTSGELINNDATGLKIFRRQWEVPSNFHAFMLYTGSSTQLILSFAYEPTGTIELQKASAHPAISDGNECYSLENAVYGIFDDAAAKNQVSIMSTNSTGYAKSDDLAPGNYWVRELTPPKGYAIDPTIYTVTVVGEQTVRVAGDRVYDMPQGDPIEFLLSKHDGERAWSAEENHAQGSASLAFAQYRVDYYDGLYDSADAAKASGAPSRTWVLQTDGDGYVNLALGESTFEYEGKSYAYKVSGDAFYKSLSGNITVPIGTLVIQETKAPEGYLLIDPNTGAAPAATAHKITTEPTTIAEVHTFNMPQMPEQVIRGGVSLVKHDAETKLATPQGDATLQGVTYEITTLNPEGVLVDDVEYYYGEVVKTITTDESGKATTANDALPYGHYSIKEVAPSEGYLLTDVEPREFDIEKDGVIVAVDESTSFYNRVIRGGVEIQKRDLESDLPYPLGGATLEGTVFEITNISKHAVRVDGIDYEPHEVCKTIVTGEDGRAFTSSDCLPYGTYSIVEVQPSEGYLLTDTKVRTFQIREEGVIVTLDESQDWRNQIKRGDLEFVKVDEDSMERLAHVPFALISQTTGERHIIVTDDNGYANTSATWNPHTQKTNANDEAEEAAFDDEAGIWFGLTREGWTVDPQDTLGALPYDYYTLEELPCEANEGHKLITVHDIRIKRHDVCIQLGTIDDKTVAPPDIETTAKDAFDGDKVVVGDPKSCVTDIVTYENLTPGVTYTLKGTLMDTSTGEPFLIGGKKVTSETKFTPKEADGTVEMGFTFDATAVAENTRLTVFESLYIEDELVCDHADITDNEQTVTVTPPEIGTTAYAEDKMSKLVIGDPEAVVVDTVAYKNLLVGKAYRLTATLYSAADRAPVYLDLDPLTASTEFIPDAPNGTVDVVFTFDATSLPEGDYVVTEVLTRDDMRIAEHSDVDDAGQTISLVQPEIGTTATDAADGDKEIPSDPEVTITDVVAYENLIPGKTYTITGTLYLKSSGEPLLAGDEPVASTVEFTPEETTGEVELSFTFDSTAIADDAVVAFEELSRDEVTVAVHADIEDEGQTVKVVRPEIGTTASDDADGDKEIDCDPEVTIKDVVQYKGLFPGKAYEIKGVLMDKATGEPLLVDGNQVTSSLAFTPLSPDGEVELEFTFDASELAGKEIVVFERLYKDASEIAVHADIDDEAQTVHVKEPSPQEKDTPEKGTPYDKTGVTGLWPLYAAVGACLVAGLGAIVHGIRRRNKSNVDDGADGE